MHQGQITGLIADQGAMGRPPTGRRGKMGFNAHLHRDVGIR